VSTELKYYYNGQIERYILQFMAVFSLMQVEINKKGSNEKVLIDVPIHYGSKDRVVAAIFSDNTQNKPIRLPMMSVKLASIGLAHDIRKGVGVESRDTYLPIGGAFPEDIQTVRQLMPVPYNAFFDLSLYTSNQHQQMQMLEYIMMLFDYQVQIQISDNVLDRSRITIINLESIGLEENYPLTSSQRSLITTCSFRVPIYISPPTDVRNDIVAKISAKVALVSKFNDVSLDFSLDDETVNFVDIVSVDELDSFE